MFRELMLLIPQHSLKNQKCAPLPLPGAVGHIVYFLLISI